MAGESKRGRESRPLSRAPGLSSDVRSDAMMAYSPTSCRSVCSEPTPCSGDDGAVKKSPGITTSARDSSPVLEIVIESIDLNRIPSNRSNNVLAISFLQHSECARPNMRISRLPKQDLVSIRSESTTNHSIDRSRGVITAPCQRPTQSEG